LQLWISKQVDHVAGNSRLKEIGQPRSGLLLVKGRANSGLHWRAIRINTRLPKEGV
jgi:hypothetical protein